MKVLWTPRASADLTEAVRYISQDKPAAALGVSARIYKETLQLATTPEMGRHGRMPGTRELVFYPWQYVAIYRVTPEAVRILRIRHTSKGRI